MFPLDSVQLRNEVDTAIIGSICSPTVPSTRTDLGLCARSRWDARKKMPKRHPCHNAHAK